MTINATLLNVDSASNSSYISKDSDYSIINSHYDLLQNIDILPSINTNKRKRIVLEGLSLNCRIGNSLRRLYAY